MKYYDAFSEGGFHSAFMTTYAFGTLAFEDIPFPKLRGAGCRSIVVLADRAMVNQAFADYGPPMFAGSSYHLVKASAPAAFHPKITMLVGEAKGRLFVGSANLTALGLAGNKEQIASIEYSEESSGTARLFRSAIEYLRRYVPYDDQWFSTSLERAMRSAHWLTEGAAEAGDEETGLELLFDRPDSTLLEQIGAVVGDDQIERLVVVSPYWDDRLEGLSRLRTALGDPATDILIDPNNGFPGEALSRFSGVSLFDIGAGSGSRFLHAKLIIAVGKRWDHVISGSMNCTFPALMGPVAMGNAEAAIYRRVLRNTSLALLGLDDYADEALAPQQLTPPVQPPETPHGIESSQDGGSLTLQLSRLTWTAPQNMPAPAKLLCLYDQDGNRLAELQLDGSSVAKHLMPQDGLRPKSGRVSFADGSVSAPIIITDLDVLAVSTLPPRMGKKKRLVDSLGEAVHEDLDLIEMLNRLEDLEADEQNQRSSSAPRADRQSETEEQRNYSILTYDDFIRARTNAASEHARFGLYLASRSDKGIHVLSACLNKMIGLVGNDLGALEEIEIESQNAIDLRTTEPTAPHEGSPDTKRPDLTPERTLAIRNMATAKRFQDAVNAFSERCRALKGRNITTSEMVRIRALMQIILSYAQPISGVSSVSKVLPIYHPDGHDWPRLIGRLLLQHFGTMRALQQLTVEPDEAEQRRVLEYLALANFAAKAALKAVKHEKKAHVLLPSLERLVHDLFGQTRVILDALAEDKAYFDEISIRLDERFTSQLRL